jgi:phosphate transport system substrate-binding protein
MSLRAICAAATINLALMPSLSAEPSGRKHIYIVGSSTVYPFSKAVAAQVAASTDSPAPVVEATGTGAGLEAFCAGTGDRYPDIANASRRMLRSEFERCATNGVKHIVEIPIGVDGVAVVRGKSGAPFTLTAAHLFLALAKDVPDTTGQPSRNPFKKWSQIDPSLPHARHSCTWAEPSPRHARLAARAAPQGGSCKCTGPRRTEEEGPAGL